MPSPEQWQEFCAANGIDRGRLEAGRSMPEDTPARSYIDPERKRAGLRGSNKPKTKRAPLQWWQKLALNDRQHERQNDQ